MYVFFFHILVDPIVIATTEEPLTSAPHSQIYVAAALLRISRQNQYDNKRPTMVGEDEKVQVY